jgi:hypothetical protein
VTRHLAGLALDKIRVDPGLQSRAELDAAAVGEYAQLKKDGVVFPEIVVFYDQTDYWLAAGFHRYYGYEQAGLKTVPVGVIDGGRREAILYAAGENVGFGLRRSIDDMAHAAKLLLLDEEWGKWSDNEIAAVCQVQPRFVRGVRSACKPPDPRRKYKTANGEVREMDTSNIGKGQGRNKPDPEPPGDVEDVAGDVGVDEGVRTRDNRLDRYGETDVPGLEKRTLRAARKFFRFCSLLAEVRGTNVREEIQRWLREAQRKEADSRRR